MRSYRHWTLRYGIDRVAQILYQKAHRDCPWLTRQANEILDGWLMNKDTGLELGSGRSTAWFARRLSRLISLEHDPNWAAKVRKILRDAGIENVDYRLIPLDVDHRRGCESAYVKELDSFPRGSLDFCLVDGVYREFCVLRIVDKIRPGGILVIDNVNWYFPSNSRSPHSRSLKDGPAGPVWEEASARLSDWRRIWTSSGVTDTAIYIKPCCEHSNRA